MNFKKLALASAIATLPVGAFALDEINDDALSEVSGQDGITMTLVTNTSGISTTAIYLHDKDGIAGGVGYTSYSFDGAIVIENMTIGAGTAKTITIGIDAGDNVITAGAPILNINIGLPSPLTIATGAIKVANSQRDAAAGSSWSVDTISATILNNMNVTLSGTTLNIQLGNEQQTGGAAGTDMIRLASTVTGGLTIGGFRLSDVGSGGGIGAAGNITVTGAGSTDLALTIDGNVTNAGLVLDLATVGSATGLDIRIIDQYLGTSTNAKLGDVSIVGLNLNGSTLTINGK